MASEPKPWLSVVLPVHNGEQWVGAALESIAIQADPGIEVVIIDTSDGPGTRAIVESYSDRLQIRIVDPAGAEGCMAKTNRGVSEARADHISWLCQDDLWLAGRTDAVRRWVGEAPEAVLHMGPAVIVDSAGRTRGTWHCPLSANETEPDRERLLSKLLVQNFLFAASLVVRRDAWLALGGLEPRLWYTADWDLWLKLAKQGPVRFHTEVTAGFRVHGNSATVHLNRAREECIRQQTVVVERHIGSLPAARGGPAAGLRVRQHQFGPRRRRGRQSGGALARGLAGRPARTARARRVHAQLAHSRSRPAATESQAGGSVLT